MRSVLGSISLTVGLASALATVFLVFRAGHGWLIGGAFCVAMVLLVGSMLMLRSEPPPSGKRWLIVAPTLAAGLVGAILAIVTSGSGTVAVSNDNHRLWVRIFGTAYDLETGPFESMYAKMLLWGVGIGLVYVTVASLAGATLGAVIHRRTIRCTGAAKSGSSIVDNQSSPPRDR